MSDSVTTLSSKDDRSSLQRGDGDDVTIDLSAPRHSNDLHDSSQSQNITVGMAIPEPQEYLSRLDFNPGSAWALSDHPLSAKNTDGGWSFIASGLAESAVMDSRKVGSRNQLVSLMSETVSEFQRKSSELTTLNEMYEQERKKRNGIEAEKIQLESRLEAMEIEIEIHKRKLQEKEIELELVKARSARLQDMTKSFEGETMRNIELAAQNEANQEQLNTLKQLIQQLKESNRQLLSQLKQTRESEQSIKEMHRETIEEYKSQVLLFEHEVQKHRTEIGANKEVIQSLEKALSEKENQIISCTQKLESNNRLILELQENIKKMESGHRTLEMRLETKGVEVSSQVQSLERLLDEQKSESVAIQSSLRQELADAQKELSLRISAIVKLESDNKQLKDQLSNVLDESNSKQITIAELESDVDKLQTLLDDKEGLINSLERGVEVRDKQIEQLTTQLSLRASDIHETQTTLLETQLKHDQLLLEISNILQPDGFVTDCTIESVKALVQSVAMEEKKAKQEAKETLAQKRSFEQTSRLRLDSVEKELQERNLECKSLDAQCSEFKGLNQDLQNQLKYLQAQLESEMTRIAAMENKYRLEMGILEETHRIEVARISQALGDEKAHASRWEQHYIESEATVAKLKAQLSSLSDRYTKSVSMIVKQYSLPETIRMDSIPEADTKVTESLARSKSNSLSMSDDQVPMESRPYHDKVDSQASSEYQTTPRVDETDAQSCNTEEAQPRRISTHSVGSKAHITQAKQQPGQSTQGTRGIVTNPSTSSRKASDASVSSKPSSANPPTGIPKPQSKANSSHSKSTPTDSDSTKKSGLTRRIVKAGYSANAPQPSKLQERK
eukprot:TRINITY_DN5224_c0_g1_i2.p1 TRINITY_DN5224_c0_g1~~TRINITY_DN5224_c0_g1_i2.p1  ORF type:complete len:846 (-),score=197.03 TRINITY_DN5224_c0_g1_i2:120-2657(-)